VKKISF
jgi:hypothetical protein